LGQIGIAVLLALTMFNEKSAAGGGGLINLSVLVLVLVTGFAG
jgi:hypothetical protein